MRQNNKADMTIPEQIESIKSKICDDYCKFTVEYLSRYEDPDEAYEKLTEEKCSSCPLSEL